MDQSKSALITPYERISHNIESNEQENVGNRVDSHIDNPSIPQLREVPTEQIIYPDIDQLNSSATQQEFKVPDQTHNFLIARTSPSKETLQVQDVHSVILNETQNDTISKSTNILNFIEYQETQKRSETQMGRTVIPIHNQKVIKMASATMYPANREMAKSLNTFRRTQYQQSSAIQEYGHIKRQDFNVLNLNFIQKSTSVGKRIRDQTWKQKHRRIIGGIEGAQLDSNRGLPVEVAKIEQEKVIKQSYIQKNRAKNSTVDLFIKQQTDNKKRLLETCSKLQFVKMGNENSGLKQQDYSKLESHKGSTKGLIMPKINGYQTRYDSVDSFTHEHYLGNTEQDLYQQIQSVNHSFQNPREYSPNTKLLGYAVNDQSVSSINLDGINKRSVDTLFSSTAKPFQPTRSHFFPSGQSQGVLYQNKMRYLKNDPNKLSSTGIILGQPKHIQLNLTQKNTNYFSAVNNRTYIPKKIKKGWVHEEHVQKRKGNLNSSFIETMPEAFTSTMIQSKQHERKNYINSGSQRLYDLL